MSEQYRKLTERACKAAFDSTAILFQAQQQFLELGTRSLSQNRRHPVGRAQRGKS